jgi:type VI secretion system protein ImpI/type VI secretion system protein
MPLILTILSFKGEPVSAATRVEFDNNGGSIGRNDKNHLVLHSPAVSSFHALIEFRDGQYSLKDGEYEQQFLHVVLKKPSTNGTQLVHADGGTRILKGDEAVLLGHERIYIGEYELGVEIQVQPAAALNFSQPAVSPGGPFGQYVSGNLGAAQSQIFPPIPGFGDLAQPIAPEFPGFGAAHAEPFPEPVNNWDFLSSPAADPSPFSAPPEPPASAGLSVFAGQAAADPFGSLPATPFAASYAPAAVASPTESNPENILHKLVELYAAGADNVRKVESVSPVFSLEPQNSQAVYPITSEIMAGPETIGNPDLLAAFLEGAGISEVWSLSAEQQSDAMRTAGVLFRSMVTGLMDELQARKAMKAEFRLSRTVLKPRDNNPLKFEPDVGSFIKSMLASPDPTFIRANDAVVEGFRDLKFHRLAMTAAFQASLISQLNHFDPENLERETTGGNPLTKKSRCWEHYCEKFPELKNLAIEEIFGEEFADEYEKQMRLLSGR